MLRPTIALAMLVIATSALANADDDSEFLANICRPIEMPKARIEAKNGKWIDLTPDQFQFARGIYIAAPDTPVYLPPGDRAAMAIYPDEDTAEVFFVDGELACGPLFVAAQFRAALMAVGRGDVRHASPPM